MTYETFLASLNEEQPPEGLSRPLLALWYDKKGDWAKGHEIADSVHGPATNWVHAYLHRVEGDEWNAKYWYRKANKSLPSLSLQEEWEALVKAFLS